MAKQKLTKEIVNEFSIVLTKSNLMLRFVVDAKRQIVYPVPRNLDHIDVAALILGTKKEKIIKNPKIANIFVGVVMELVNNIVDGMIIAGKTTLTGAGIRYRKRDVEIAAKAMLNFVKRGELPVSEKLRFIVSNDFISEG